MILRMNIKTVKLQLHRYCFESKRHSYGVVARRRFRESRCKRYEPRSPKLDQGPGLRVAPRPFSYRRTVQIIEAIRPSAVSPRTQTGPRRCIFNGESPFGGQSPRCDNNQRNKPTYDQQEYTSPVRPASVSRTTCPLNIHEPLASCAFRSIVRVRVTEKRRSCRFR